LQALGTSLVSEAAPVGFQSTADTWHGFLYTAGTFTTIDVPDGLFTRATGINDASQIVGFDGRDRGFLYTAGTLTTIAVPVPGARTEAHGINNAGQIVGQFTDNSGGHGFLYDAGIFTSIDVPAGLGLSTAWGINDAGQIVGGFEGRQWGEARVSVHCGHLHQRLMCLVRNLPLLPASTMPARLSALSWTPVVGATGGFWTPPAPSPSLAFATRHVNDGEGAGRVKITMAGSAVPYAQGITMLARSSGIGLDLRRYPNQVRCCCLGRAWRGCGLPCGSAARAQDHRSRFSYFSTERRAGSPLAT
jgi:probable HAF family extracellular repeat protein